jgi:methionyl-tRNA formyltransferase
MLKIVFFGTPDYVLPILEALHKEFKTKQGGSPIVAVVTQRPKPTGRKQILTFSAVDSWAHKRGIPIYFEPEEVVKDNLEVDIGILASYARIIPKRVLEYFPKGILNIHPSLLPKYRGASPIQAALTSAESITGVSIIKLDEKLDHGPIITQFKEEIIASDTSEALRDRLFEKSAKVLVELLPAYLKGKINLKVQKEGEAIYTREINKDDGFIPPEILIPVLKGAIKYKEFKVNFVRDYKISASPQSLDCFARAMTPWPGVWTKVALNPKNSKEVKRLKIVKTHLDINNHFVIDEVQLEGKNPVTWKQFIEGYPKNSLIA